MTVWWHLLLGHLLADFVLKKDNFKMVCLIYLSGRSLLYFIVLAICCFKYLSLPWISIYGINLNGWLCLVFTAFIYFAVNMCGKYFKVSAKEQFAVFVLRQIVLVLVLFLISPTVNFEGGFKHYIWGPDWLLIVNFCLVITYGISAFLLNLSSCINGAVNTQGLFDKRFLNNLFRFIIFLLLVIPGFLFPFIALILVLSAGRYSLFKDERNYLYGGCIITAALAILFRGIFY